MRIQIGNIPAPETSVPESAGWARIVGPSSWTVHLMAWIIGIAMLTLLLALIVVTSLLIPPPTGNPRADQPTPWLAVALTFVVAVPAHELLHALFHPGGGFSPATVLVAWPRKLRFGVYFEGRVSRRRWLVMRLAPLAVLAIVPALALIATAAIPRSFTLETSLALLLMINALGSGSDVFAAAWVLANIPRGSTLGFWGGKAYWRPG